MTDTKFTPAQIDAAVEWWAKALGHPKYDALGPRRHDSPTEVGYYEEQRERRPMEFASVMMQAMGAKLTGEQIDAFAAHLRDVLAGRCAHTWKDWQGVERPMLTDWILSVDYHPDPVLEHCGEIAGFPSSFFWPIKTTMWLRPDDGSVKVRYGYGAEIQTIVPPKS